MQLLHELFSELKTPGIPENRRKSLVLFLKELCSFAQSLQPQSRELFYKVQFPILFCLFTSDDEKTSSEWHWEAKGRCISFFSFQNIT
jgi:hypothetical protein